MSDHTKVWWNEYAKMWEPGDEDKSDRAMAAGPAGWRPQGNERPTHQVVPLDVLVIDFRADDFDPYPITDRDKALAKAEQIREWLEPPVLGCNRSDLMDAALEYAEVLEAWAAQKEKP